ncbi:MAG: hypothetical protein ACYSYV_04380 [Planctomycetota bacterium]|jgi:hypothetical protein
MKLYKHGEIALFVSLLAVSVLVVGCVVCQTDEHYTGIENEALEQVEPGQTTKDELVERFGEPTEQLLTDEGTEILRYKCVRTKDNQFVLFPPPIVITDDEAVEHTVAFELRDGIVQRYWKEG